jgi:hypothetical protein
VRGWYREPARHSLAARGYKTVNDGFVYEPRNRHPIKLLRYGTLKADGDYHLVKKRVWDRDVRNTSTVMLPTYDPDIGWVGVLSSKEKKFKLFQKSFYNKPNAMHGFGYIIEPEQNRIRAIQIVDMEDNVFDESRMWNNYFLDIFVRGVRGEHPDHRVVTMEVDIPVSKLSRENPGNYFAGMRYAFDDEGNLIEHVTEFIRMHVGPKMRYVVLNSYKDRESAFNDWKRRNQEMDKTGEISSEYARWFSEHKRKLE